MILRLLVNDDRLIRNIYSEVDPHTGQIELEADTQIKPLQAYEPSFGMTGVPEILEFLLGATTTVACEVLAAWIYDKIKDRKAKAEINGKELPASQKEIQTVILVILEKNGK